MLSNEDNISFLEQTIIEIEFLLSDTEEDLNFYNHSTYKRETLYINDFKRDLLRNVVEPYNEYKKSPQFYYDSSCFKSMRKLVPTTICAEAYKLLIIIKSAKISNRSKQVNNKNDKVIINKNDLWIRAGFLLLATSLILFAFPSIYN
jgi:hypothetical protein